MMNNIGGAWRAVSGSKKGGLITGVTTSHARCLSHLAHPRVCIGLAAFHRHTLVSVELAGVWRHGVRLQLKKGVQSVIRKYITALDKR